MPIYLGAVAIVFGLYVLAGIVTAPYGPYYLARTGCYIGALGGYIVGQVSRKGS